MGKPDKLRFAVIAIDRKLRAWQVDALEKLIRSNFAELRLVIHIDKVISRPRSFDTLFGSGWLFQLYLRHFVDRRSTSCRILNAERILSGADELWCRPIVAQGTPITFADADIEAIRSHDLDFIVDFGSIHLRGDIVQSARLGIWSYRHNERGIGSAVAGFWEIFHGHAATGGSLRRLTESPSADLVLYRARLKTVRHSFRKNRDQLYAQSSDWLEHVARRVVIADGDLAAESVGEADGPINRYPTAREFLACTAKMIWSAICLALHRLFVLEIWNIGHGQAEISTVIADKKLPPFAWLPERGRRHFRADPFLARTEGEIRCLFEDGDALGNGRIGVMNPSRANAGSGSEILAAATFHLSYPFVFSNRQGTYCVLESSAVGGVPLYEYREGRLRFLRDLLPGVRSVDATILHSRDRFWLFCGLANDLPDHKLHIFHAEELDGPYAPHVDNPVKVDITGARPAGPFFEVGDTLYRPAQNCAESYGGSLSIFKVEALTTHCFREVRHCSFLPDPHGRYRDGLHTLCHLDGNIVVDGKRQVLSLLPARRALAHLMRRGRQTDSATAIDFGEVTSISEASR